jgi:hypothetical protein
LGDPLLSKLPVLTPNDWRIGHFKRGIPAGYIESLQAGMNLLEDPKIAELYRSINLLARAPIWGGRRFKEIAKMNLGFYNETIRSLALPSSMAAPPSGTGFSWPMPARRRERAAWSRSHHSVTATDGRQRPDVVCRRRRKNQLRRAERRRANRRDDAPRTSPQRKCETRLSC